MKGNLGYKRYFKQFHKRKRFSSKRIRNPSRIGKNQVATHFFKRTIVKDIAITDLAFQPLTLTTAQNAFRLDELPNITDFTSLYDTYKICGIKCKYMFGNNNADVAVATQSLPNLLTINDYNDSTLTSETEMIQYASFKTTRMDRITTRYFRPCQEVDTTNTNVVRSRWNPTSQADIVHRGLKCAVSSPLSGGGAVAQGKLKVYITYYLAMRTPK